MDCARIGVITMAFGKDSFCRMAMNLAHTVRKFAPGIPLTIVTTEEHMDQFRLWYDNVILLDASYGGGMRQKLYLYDYSPYEETIVLDADTLVLRPIDKLIEAFRSHDDFVVLGGKRFEDGWRYSLREAQAAYDIPWIAQFNGGCYYFKKTKRSESIVRLAQEYGSDWTNLCEILKIGDKDKSKIPLSEEVVLSLSLAKHGIEPLYDYEVRRMVGPLQMRAGSFDWDILKGRCICRNEGGVTLYPYIGHFFWNSDDGFHYRREIYRLSSFLKDGAWGRIYSGWVSCLLNVMYGGLTAVYYLTGVGRLESRRIRLMQAGIPMSYFGKGLLFRLKSILEICRK